MPPTSYAFDCCISHGALNIMAATARFESMPGNRPMGQLRDRVVHAEYSYSLATTKTPAAG